MLMHEPRRRFGAMLWPEGNRARVFAVALVGALVVTLPALVGSLITGKGYIIDDFMQLCAWRGCAYPGGPAPDDLFRFASGNPVLNRLAMDQGVLPWFAHPEVKLTFFRPLSAWLQWFDVACFDGWVVAAKVHSILWYLALVLAVTSLYLRVLPKQVCGPAALVFALAATHFQPALWVASRNASVSTLFGVLALICHVQPWARYGRWRYAASVGLYLLALAAGEVALGMLFYLASYEPCVRPARSNHSPWRGAFTFASVSVLWLVIYKLGGYGALHSGDYLDPWSAPWAFLGELPERLMALLGMGYLGFPGDLWLLKPSSQPLAIACGVAAALLVTFARKLVWAHWDQNERRTFVWMASASSLALLPPAAGGLSGRSLLVPSIGMSVVVVLVMVGCWRCALGASQRGHHQWWCGAVSGALGLVHLVIAPASWIFGAVFYFAMLEKIDVATRDALDQTAGKTGILLQTPDVFVGRYLPFERRSRGAPAPVVWRALSLARAEHRVHRTRPDAFELEVVGGRMLETPLEKIMRSPQEPLHRGDGVELQGMRVSIKETDAIGPTRVEFRFRRVLEDPSVAFFAWRNGKVERFAFPVIGQSVTLPWSLGPSGL